MAIYSVYLPPEIGNRVLDADRARAAFLPDTKSLWALIIPAIWLLWNRLWLPFLAYVAILLMLAVIGSQWNAQLALLLSGLPGLFLFLEGNELVRLRHEREGWIFDGIIEAPDKKTAELRFFAATTVRDAISAPKQGPSSSPPGVSTSLSNLFPE